MLYPSAFEGLGIRPAAHVLDDYRRQREAAAADLPPAIQWAGRIPVLQPLAWLTTFTIGPGAVLAALGGAAVLVRRRRALGWWAVLVPIAFVAVPFAFVEATTVPSGRYYASMVPGVAVLGGVGIGALVVRARARGSRTAGVTAAALLALSALWAIAFVHGVYGHVNTRIEASEWIDEHVPEGSVLSLEGWDDGLPLGLPGIDPARWEHQQFDLFGPDDEEKVERLATQLAGVDYVVESSPRLWRTVTRLPARYPSTINFFEGLDDGSLGFERVATFTSPPRLGPFRLDDGWAEEAFSVYDHPEVRIWQRVRDVPRADVLEVLDLDAAATALPVHPGDGHANGTLLQPDEAAANRDLPTYDDTFDRGHAWWHALGWLVLFMLAAAAAWVLLLPVLGRLPDAGAGLAPLVGIAGPALALFSIVSWTPIELGRPLVAATFVVWLGLGSWLGWRRRGAIGAVWRERRALVLAGQVAVLAAFAGALLLRAANPDLWHPARGGEKVFELTFLTSVLRTRTLPPPDPWFSGGAINYYYGGWFLASLPGRLLRTSPSVAIQLVLPLFAAAAAGAASSAAAALARTRARLGAAIIAPVAVLVLGNLAIAVAWWERRTGAIDWWGLSRVIPASSSITEFPAWSFLYGDAHPHVMGIAIVMATLALAVAAHGALVDGARTPALVLAGLLGASIGFARMTNTWDAVPLALIVVFALGAAWRHRAPWTLVAGAAAIVGAVVVVVFAPYAWRMEVIDVGLVGATEQTSMSSFLQQFGLFAAVSAVAVAAGVRTGVDRMLLAGGVLVVGGGTLVAPDRAVTLVTVGLAIALVLLAVARIPVASPPALLVVAGGWAIVAAVDVVTLRDDIGPRMNTIFKYWYVAWQLLALGSAVLVAEWLVARAHVARRRAAVVLTAAGAALALAFWVLATPARLEDRVSDGGLSLDGEAFAADSDPIGAVEAENGTFELADDMALVEWLRANAPGGTVIAEAPGIDYRWTSRISAFTGLPTPIGFDWHESQQRSAYGAQVDERIADVNDLYAATSTHRITELLSRYGIELVVFGTQERPLATATSERALWTHPCVDVVFESGRDWIGAVDSDCVAVSRSG